MITQRDRRDRRIRRVKAERREVPRYILEREIYVTIREIQK